MLHVRLIAPRDLSSRALDLLSGLESVTNVVRYADAALKPPGDVVTCDVAREDGSVVLTELRRLDGKSNIAVELIDVALSEEAERCEAAAAGTPGDSVLWEEVEAKTSDAAELNGSYLAFMILATLIAAVGVLTDSVVLIIGAMVVGPEYGPLAGVCVAAVQRRARLALRSLWSLWAGFGLAIAASWLVVVGLRATGVAPAELHHVQTLFIANPDAYALLIALLAGIAGMLALTTAKSGALIGVFISVTTVPAAANMAVAAAYRDLGELRGAALQLAVNVAAILLAGIATLAIQRLAFVRRLRQYFRAKAASRRARRRRA